MCDISHAGSGGNVVFRRGAVRVNPFVDGHVGAELNRNHLVVHAEIRRNATELRVLLRGHRVRGMRSGVLGPPIRHAHALVVAGRCEEALRELQHVRALLESGRVEEEHPASLGRPNTMPGNAKVSDTGHPPPNAGAAVRSRSLSKRTRRRVARIAACALTFLMVAVAMVAFTPLASAQPSVVDLGTLGGTSSEAFGINDLGQVVGVSDTTAGALLLNANGHTRTSSLASTSREWVPAQPGAAYPDPPIGGEWINAGPSGVVNCGLTGVLGITVNLLGKCSGRVTAVAVDPSDSSGNTVYVGGAQGGVWKTTDGGSTWTPLLDNPIQPDGTSVERYDLAVGSMTIDPSGIVYVGTGEGGNNCADCLYGQGILKSTDGGGHWTQLDPSTQSCPQTSFGRSSFTKIAISPANPNMVLAATTLGVFVSTDAGQSWGSGSGCWLPTLRGVATDVVFSPIPNSTVFAAVDGQVFSSNDGLTWTRSTTPQSTSSSPGGCFSAGVCGRINLAIAAYPPTTELIAATQDGTVWRTFDSGDTWALMTSPSSGAPFGVTNFCTEAVGSQCDYDIVVAIDPTDPSIIFLGGQDLWVTTDGGNSWGDIGGYDGNSISTGNIHSDQHAFAFSPANSHTIYVGNDGGIWTTTFHSVSVCVGQCVGGYVFPWKDLNSGLSIAQFYSVAANPQQLNNFFGGTQDLGILQHDCPDNTCEELSVTGPIVWDDTNPGDAWWAAYDTADPTTTYAGFTGFSGGACGGGSCLLRTSASCILNFRGWCPITGGLTSSDLDTSFFPQTLAVDPTTPTTLYFGNSAKLFKTVDQGSSWTATSLDMATACGGPCGGTLSSVSVAPPDGASVYVGTSNGKFFASSDGATTFVESHTGLPPGAGIARTAVDPIDPSVVHAGFGGFTGGGNHLFVSTNAGSTWTDISQTVSGLPDSPVDSIAVDSAGTGAIYVGNDVGVYVSLDKGTTWQVLGTGLPRVQVMDLVFSAGNVALLAATHGRGVWTLSHLPSHPLTYVSVNSRGLDAAADVVTADCYPGDFATGGGFRLDNGLRDVVSSQPSGGSPNPTSWTVQFGVGAGGTGITFADCMVPVNIAGSTTSSYVVATPRVIGSCGTFGCSGGDQAGSAVSQCNSGDFATGGGYVTGSTKIALQSHPDVTSGQPSAWVSFFGVSLDFLSTVTVTSTVVCMSGTGFSTTVSSTAGLSVACSFGDVAVGGGYKYTGGAPLPITSEPNIPSGVATGWSTSAALSYSTATAYVVCLVGGTSTTVSCSPTSVLVGAQTTCSVEVADDDSSSSLTPSGPVLVSSSQPGSFTPVSASCNLVGTGASASCPVDFSPNPGSVGAISISATYNGDANHDGSTGTFSLNVYDFTVTATPSDQTVLRGSYTTYSITTSLVPGSAGAPSTVGIVASGLPADATLSGLSALALPGTGTLTVQTGAASLGDYALTVSGTVQGGSRSSTANLHIYDFTMTAPSSLLVLTTGKNSFTVTLNLSPGSTLTGLPTITLSDTGLPPGATSQFIPSSGSLSFTSTFNVTTVNTPAGSYMLTLTGTDSRSPEGGQRSVPTNLVVLTPQQGLQLLVNQVNTLQSSGVLNSGQAGSLIAKLTHAIGNLNKGDKTVACNELTALVNQVKSYVATGVLTQAQANLLLGGPLGVYAIMAAIPC